MAAVVERHRPAVRPQEFQGPQAAALRLAGAHSRQWLAVALTRAARQPVWGRSLRVMRVV